LLNVGIYIDYQHAAQALDQLEPHIPWKEELLRYRAECYQAIASPLAERANRDLRLFLKNKVQPFTL